MHTLSFLKNGRLLGVARTLPPGKELFPCAATNERGQSVIALAVDPEASSDSKLVVFQVYVVDFVQIIFQGYLAFVCFQVSDSSSTFHSNVLQLFYRCLPIFLTFLGDLDPQQLPLRRL